MRYRVTVFLGKTLKAKTLKLFPTLGPSLLVVVAQPMTKDMQTEQLSVLEEYDRHKA